MYIDTFEGGVTWRLSTQGSLLEVHRGSYVTPKLELWSTSCRILYILPYHFGPDLCVFNQKIYSLSHLMSFALRNRLKDVTLYNEIALSSLKDNF